MIQRTNTYETLFIVNPNLEETQIEAIATKVKDLITKNGGNILSTNMWGRRRLTYNIKNRNTGFYVLVEFTAPAESISTLERFFNIEEEIMRHLILKLDKKALKAQISAAAQVETKSEDLIKSEN